MPTQFELFQPADVYVPFTPWAATLPEDRGWHPGIFPIARLKDGVSIDDARVEMDAISQQLEAEFPDSNKNFARARQPRAGRGRAERPAGAPAVERGRRAGAADRLRQRRQPAARRAVDRQKEIAVRMAIGASRWRIVRQLITESLLLACIGGGAGLLVATVVGVAALHHAVTGLPRAHNIAVDWPVVFFALGLSALTGLVFGIAPAFKRPTSPCSDR